MKLSRDKAREVLDFLDFEEGLITAIIRDYEDKEVLMAAFMNKEAVIETLTSGLMHFWSRSREELWLKGEESENKQIVKNVRIDCDGDALLFDVDPEGPACHEGYRSCFYREVNEEGNFNKVMEREFDPDEVYE